MFAPKKESASWHDDSLCAAYFIMSRASLEGEKLISVL